LKLSVVVNVTELLRVLTFCTSDARFGRSTDGEVITAKLDYTAARATIAAVNTKMSSGRSSPTSLLTQSKVEETSQNGGGLFPMAGLSPPSDIAANPYCCGNEPSHSGAHLKERIQEQARSVWACCPTSVHPPRGPLPSNQPAN
jgi:hypothetical protein